jgi:adenylylsulfate kinase-like enzyme
MTVAERVLQVLWICGPPCVGKSTTAWSLYDDLVEAGGAVGYVDIDQLGMCYPTEADDIDRHQIKARNVGSVLNNFRVAGARAAIVSGVIEPDVVSLYVQQCTGSAITFCRLRLGRDELAVRNDARGRHGEDMTAVLRNADLLDDSNFADAVIDADGLGVDQVFRCVRSALPGWAEPPPTRVDGGEDRGESEGLMMSTCDGPLVWLYGQPGVGKSSVAWALFVDEIGNRTTSYVDLGQIGFFHPAGPDDPENHHLKAANLAAMWGTYQAAGAETLIVSGNIQDGADLSHYRAALPQVTMTMCRLRASREDIEQRIFQRGQGGGPPLAGDALIGAPAAMLRQAIQGSVITDEALDRSPIGDLCVDTSGLDVEAVADAVRSVTGFERHP